MKELAFFYEKMTAKLKDKHEEWVTSNRKMRSIELALRQVHDQGDTVIGPAVSILKDEYNRENHRNDKLCNEMNALCRFVREIEAEAKDYGQKWQHVEMIMGY